MARRDKANFWTAPVIFDGDLMLSYFYPKSWKFKVVCLGLFGASIVGSVGSLLKGDLQVTTVPAHAVDSLLTAGMTGTAGSATHMLAVHDQITGQRYVAVWPDQRRPVAIGSTDPARNEARLEVQSRGPTGSAIAIVSEFPNAPPMAAA